MTSFGSASFFGKETLTMSKSLTTIKGIPLAPADVTPGDILSEEFLKPLGMSQTALAKRMRVDPMRINAIVRGKRAITAETAIRLAAVFGTSARFWLGLQNDHDLAIGARENWVEVMLRCPVPMDDLPSSSREKTPVSSVNRKAKKVEHSKNPNFEKVMEAARTGVKKHRNTLRALAKSSITHD
jgi:antitoxin HigA-1